MTFKKKNGKKSEKNIDYVFVVKEMLPIELSARLKDRVYA